MRNLRGAAVLVWAALLALSACARGLAGVVAPAEAGPVMGPTGSTPSTPTGALSMEGISTPAPSVSAVPGALSMPPSTSLRMYPERSRRMYTATPTLEPFAVCSPLAEHARQDLSAIISAPYAPPPKNKPEERHHGVDFAYYNDHGRDSILGETVQSVLGGKVSMALSGRFPYGNAVIVETPGTDLPPDLALLVGLEEGQSLYLIYAHLGAAPEVALGEEIEACRRLGEAGQSGNAGAPHLHLEARVGPAGVVFESMAFYQLPLTPEEMAAYTRWRTGGEFRHFDPMILVNGEW